MTIQPKILTDTQLVDECLAGDREAFGRIVKRYQGLICALAYSACGDVARSEDLAQETFLAGWRGLKTLKDRAHLKQWLCGIARHIINDSYRRAARDPVALSRPLEEAVPDGKESQEPSQQAISKEEQYVLWRMLEGLPETYREPLVLYYRQSQSVAEVAQTLELSEDAVKQRLSRGRVLLGERVAKFVEAALPSTGPSKSFSLGVLAALPAITASSKAAVIGATAAKGGAAAKSAGLIGIFSAIFGPAIAALGLYAGYRLDRDSAPSPQRRKFIAMGYRIIVACIVAFVGAVLALAMLWQPLAQTRPGLYAGLFVGLGAAYIVAIVAVNVWMMRKRRGIRCDEIAENRLVPMLQPMLEYRSKLALFGLPLVHIRVRGGLERGPVKAWIAVGDVAIGVIFAIGAVAIAPISFGGLAFGLLPVGGFAAGLVPLGGFSLGVWALGAFAVAWNAFGGCAVGWRAARGGVAVARQFAEGGAALARHTNDPVAAAYFQNSPFYSKALVVVGHAQWLNLIALVPVGLWWWSRKKIRTRMPQGR